MSTLVRKQLKDELEAQLLAQFQVESLDDHYLVITPLLYPDNSHVCLYVGELGEDRLTIADDGEAAAYSFVLGMSEAEIEDRVRKARHRFRLMSSNDDELRLEIARGQLAEVIFALATAVQDVAYLVYKHRDY